MNDETRTGSTRTTENEFETKHGIDIAKEARELAAINPRVAREFRRILDSGEQPSASPEPSANGANDANCETSCDRAAEASASDQIEAAAPPPKALARRKLRARRKKSPARPARPLTSLDLHQARCQICNSDDLEEIDEAFVSWENVRQMAHDHKIDRRAIYRHAHATGLYDRRDRNIRRALGRIIHEADASAPSADSVIRAIKMLTHVNSRGQWVNPSTRVVFSSETPARAARTSTGEVTHRAK
jgi:hypothetical protein